MKRKHIITAIAVLTLIMMLAGCGKSEFGVVINKDYNVEITAVNAKADSSGAAGTFSVGEGEKVLIEPAFETGSVLVQFYALDEELNEGNNLPEGDPAYEIEISGTDSIECVFGQGDFLVQATVKEKASGSAVIEAKSE